MILSKFSKDTKDISSPISSKYKTPGDGISQIKDPIWHEFLIGMSMIKSNRYHTQADLVPVAKSNMRLLYRQLESNLQYKSHMQNTKSGFHDPWYWSNLNNEADLEAGLLTIDDKSPIKFNCNPISNLDDYAHIGLMNNCLEGAFQMFLVVSGKVSVNNISPFPSHNSTKTNEECQIFKSGGVIFNNVSQSTLQTIRSLKPHSTLLVVHLPDYPHHTEYQGITRN